jgi:hypothetical protein
MAMYAVLSDGQEIQWHVGEDVKEIWQPHNPKLPRRVVVELQADGHELEHVLKNFSNIPIRMVNRVPHRSMIWFGDHARFIYHNLRG